MFHVEHFFGHSPEMKGRSLGGPEGSERRYRRFLAPSWTGVRCSPAVPWSKTGMLKKTAVNTRSAVSKGRKNGMAAV